MWVAARAGDRCDAAGAVPMYCIFLWVEVLLWDGFGLEAHKCFTLITRSVDDGEPYVATLVYILYIKAESTVHVGAG